MNTEVVASSTQNTSKLTYNVLVEQAESGNYAATILGWSECNAEGATKEEALTKLNQVVNARLQKAEIVSLEIDNPKAENPWLKLAGKYKDDPQFDEMLEYIEQYRRELDAETEANYIQDDRIASIPVGAAIINPKMNIVKPNDIQLTTEDQAK